MAKEQLEAVSILELINRGAALFVSNVVEIAFEAGYQPLPWQQQQWFDRRKIDLNRFVYEVYRDLDLFQSNSVEVGGNVGVPKVGQDNNS